MAAIRRAWPFGLAHHRGEQVFGSAAIGGFEQRAHDDTMRLNGVGADGLEVCHP